MWTLPVVAALISPAEAGSLADLDQLPGLFDLTWGSAPPSGLHRVGGNGASRMQYRWQGPSLPYEKYETAAVSFEYVDDRLATVIMVIRHRYDAEGIAARMSDEFGAPTWQDATTRVWRGQVVRAVWRQQDDKMWVVTFAWLALNPEDDEP
jgi:hypothetical protein